MSSTTVTNQNQHEVGTRLAYIQLEGVLVISVGFDFTSFRQHLDDAFAAAGIDPARVWIREVPPDFKADVTAADLVGLPDANNSNSLRSVVAKNEPVNPLRLR